MNPPVLRDIHLPDASLWWPPAPGWWLGLLAIVLLTLVLPRLWCWIRRRPLKRVALDKLEQIRIAHQQGRGEGFVAKEICALLRRVTISYYGRGAAAAKTGEDWQRQLQELVPQAAFSAEQLEWLVRGRYRARAEIDIDAMLRACERWLRGLGSRDHVST